MRKLLFPLVSLLGVLSAGSASAVLTQTATFGSLNLAIPDGNPSGLANAQLVGSAVSVIQSVEVSLNITGTFNGDLYAYVTNGTGFSVLLNRSGVTASNSFGYGNDGFNVTFTGTAANGDIHTYQTLTNPGAGIQVTGLWQPDGRAVDPNTVTDASPRTALLSSFDGSSADGLWTLFVADLSGGDAHVLQSWSLTVTGIPEPASALLFLTGLATAALRRRRAH